MCRVASTRTHDGELLWVAVTPDGSRVVSGGRYGEPIHVRDTRTLHVFAKIQPPQVEGVNGVAISADGKRVAAVVTRPGKQVFLMVAKVWEVELSKLLCEVVLGDIESNPEPLAFSADGRKLAVRIAEVHIIDIASAKVERLVGDKRTLGRSLTLFAGSRFVCVEDRADARFFDTVADRELPIEWHRTPAPALGHIRHFRISADGAWVVLATADGVARYRVEVPTIDRATFRLGDPVRVSMPSSGAQTVSRSSRRAGAASASPTDSPRSSISRRGRSRIPSTPYGTRS